MENPRQNTAFEEAAILMGDCIKEVGIQAHKENRIPNSSEVISKFRSHYEEEIPDEMVHGIFDYTFKMVNQITKGKWCNPISQN